MNPRSRPQAQHQQAASSDSRDEQFTGAAAQQRRTSLQASEARTRMPQANGKAQGANESLANNAQAQKTRSERDSDLAVSNARRSSVNGRESPDALQGGTTTHPIPKKWAEKPTNAIGQQQTASQPQLNNRKRYSSDLQETELPSPSREKRSKRNHEILPLLKVTLRAAYYLIGTYINESNEFEFAPIYIVHDGIEICPDALDEKNLLKIPFRNITGAVVDDQTGLRLVISISDEEAVKSARLRIEFRTDHDTNKMLEVLTSKNIMVYPMKR